MKKKFKAFLTTLTFVTALSTSLGSVSAESLDFKTENNIDPITGNEVAGAYRIIDGKLTEIPVSQFIEEQKATLSQLKSEFSDALLDNANSLTRDITLFPADYYIWKYVESSKSQFNSNERRRVSSNVDCT
ncbi:hypothetical protein, partial [Mycobacterium tuberculosis]|uniref:hypothetical protein n=1 Tax=Mycobacterium tuberculosis TaxID=1773 RepID=UPI0015877E58